MLVEGRAATYLVDGLLALFVLLGLLLHLLPLLNVVDEREKVTQVDDERLRLDRGTKTRMWARRPRRVARPRVDKHSPTVRS